MMVSCLGLALLCGSGSMKWIAESERLESGERTIAGELRHDTCFLVFFGLHVMLF